MTHEHDPNAEPFGGPEHDMTLPDAGDVPTFDDPADSDAPPLPGDGESDAGESETD